MCFPLTPKAPPSTEDVYDLIIFEPEREEIEDALRAMNQAFNEAFLLVPSYPLQTEEHLLRVSEDDYCT